MDIAALRATMVNAVSNNTLSLPPGIIDSADLQSLTARYYPSAALSLHGVELNEIDNGIAVRGTTSVLSMTDIAATLELTLVSGSVSASLGVTVSLPEPLGQATLSLSTEGRVSGSLTIAEADVELTGEGASPVTVTGTISNLSVSTLARALTGTSVPPEVPDIEFQTVSVQVSPQTGAFSMSAEAMGRWNNDSFSIERATLGISHSRGEPLAFDLYLFGSSAKPIVPECQLTAVNLGFSRSAEAWSVSGEVRARLYNRDLQLNASYRQDGTSQVLQLATTLPDLVIVDIPGIATWTVAQLQLEATRAGTANAAASPSSTPVRETTMWTLSGTGALHLTGVMDIAGTLSIFRTPESSGVTFEPDPTKAGSIRIPLPTPESANGQPAMLLAPGSIAAIRMGEPPKLVFRASCDLSFTGLPTRIAGRIPSTIQTTFEASREGVKLTADPVMSPFGFSLPDITIAGESVALGTAAIEVSNLAIKLGSDVALAVDIGVGLPSDLNKVFGVKSDGTPSFALFKTYDAADPEKTMVRGTLRLSATGVTLNVLDSPFDAIKLENGWWNCDLGDCGRVRFQMPILTLDPTTQAFEASGAFEVVEPLQVPLSLLINLLHACGLDAAASALPRGLPLREIAIVDRAGQFRSEELVDLLETIAAGKLPGEVGDAINVIAGRLSRLPDRFKQYLSIQIPQSFAFQIAATATGNIKVKASVKPGDPPIRFVEPAMVGLVPGLMGVELRSLSYGAIFGGSLFLVEVDARIDRYDLLTLAGAVLLPVEESLPLPDPRSLSNRIVLDNLMMLIVYETGIPIPIPLFYDRLGIEYGGIEGVGLEAHFGFPMPSFDAGEAAREFKALRRFFTDRDYLIQQSDAPKDLNLVFSIGPTYVQLPKYLGGKVLGSKNDPVARVDLFELIASLLNGIKTIDVAKLVTSVPVDYRVGHETVAFGPLSLAAAWAITTPAEFNDTLWGRLGLTETQRADAVQLLPAAAATKDTKALIVLLQGTAEIQGIAKLDSTFCLIADSTDGFATGFQAVGQVSDLLSLRIRGTVALSVKGTRVNPKTAFALSGATTLQIAGHDAFAGDIAFKDNSTFAFSGNLDLFPPASPVRVRGAIAGMLGRNTFVASGYVYTELAGMNLLNATATLSQTLVRVQGTWIGATMLLDGRTSAGVLELAGSATFRVHVDANLGQVVKVVRTVTTKVADNLLVRADAAAAIAVRVGSFGFMADVTATFSVNGVGQSLRFTSRVAPNGLPDLARQIEREMKGRATSYFDILFTDATKFLAGVHSGLIAFGGDVDAAVGNVLKQAYALPDTAAAAVCRNAGWAADRVGRVLRYGYDAPAHAAAIALRSAGFGIGDVGKTLKDVYEMNVRSVGQVLRKAGFGQTNIIGALKDLFSFSPIEWLKILKDIF